MHLSIQACVNTQGISDVDIREAVKQQMLNQLELIDDTLNTYGLNKPEFGFVKYFANTVYKDGAMEISLSAASKYESDYKVSSDFIYKGNYKSLQEYVLNRESGEAAKLPEMHEAYTFEEILDNTCNLINETIHPSALSTGLVMMLKAN